MDETPHFATLSDRLNYALKLTGLSQSELAKQINTKPQAIQYLCRSGARKSKFTHQMADALGVESLWLAAGVGKIHATPTAHHANQTTQHEVPLLAWHEVKPYLAGNQPASCDFLATTAPTDAQGFALRLNDDAMSPRFEKESIIFINPDMTQNLHTGEFVLVYVATVDSIIFRQYNQTRSVVTLQPLSTVLHKPVVMAADDCVIGTLVEARFQPIR